MSWVRHLLIFVSDLSIKLRLWGVLMARPTKYVTVVGSVGPQSVGEEEKEGGLTTEGQTAREYVMEKKMRVGSDAGEGGLRYGFTDSSCLLDGVTFSLAR